MQNIKKHTAFALLITVCLSATSHAQEHGNSWFRATVGIPLAESIRTDLEFQHRRQNDFGNANPLDKNLMYSGRAWVYYRPNKNVTYAVSPFAYFSSYKIIRKEGDAQASPATEYRISASVELQHELAAKLFLINRTAVEYRIFDGNNQNVWRARHRVAIRYDFAPRFTIGGGDEVFINASGTDAGHIFDHNRLFANFSVKLNKRLKTDLGYIYVSRLLKNNVDLIAENNLYLNLSYLLTAGRTTSVH